MSTNKHTEDVLLEFAANGDDIFVIFREEITNNSKDYIREAQNIYDSIDQTKLNFRTELLKFLCSTKDFNGVAFDYERLTDAIIKDMHIETEREKG